MKLTVPVVICLSSDATTEDRQHASTSRYTSAHLSYLSTSIFARDAKQASHTQHAQGVARPLLSIRQGSQGTYGAAARTRGQCAPRALAKPAHHVTDRLIIVGAAGR